MKTKIATKDDIANECQRANKQHLDLFCKMNALEESNNQNKFKIG